MFEIQFNNFKRLLSELFLNEMLLKQMKSVLVKCVSVSFVVHQIIGYSIGGNHWIIVHNDVRYELFL